MSDRQVSDELAEAVIELVRECEYHDGHMWGGEEAYKDTPLNEYGRPNKDWSAYVDGVKPEIAKVIDLLMAEVEQDIIDVILRDRGYSGE